jgi:hypothetical protein
MMRRIEWIVAAGALAFVLIQLAPMSKSNPPITKDVAAPPQVESILRRGCYDCHSNETRWPWYAHLAPVSWLVVRDVDNGRKRLDFSTWDKYDDDPETLITKMRHIDKMSRNGSMPLWYYLAAHSEARLSAADRDVLAQWVSDTIGAQEQRGQSQ